MSTIKKLMMTAAGGEEPLAIEDVFSTYLYTGNNSTQTITNGIDLAGEGGMVWLKDRLSASLGFHVVYNTENGTGPDGGRLFGGTASTNALSTQADGLQSFNSDGFTLGANTYENGSGKSFASWTFRKAPRFFDVVTYTGNGTNGRNISHNLGTNVGSMIVKSTSATGGWFVWHKDIGTNYLSLQTTGSVAGGIVWNYTAPTSTVFTVADDANTNGVTYVAYLFAHDPLGPSGDGSDGLIACGSYTGNGLTDGPEINLGWEPQWLLVKRASGSGNWQLWDSMRSWCVGADSEILQANTSDPENNQDILWPQSSGFKINYSLVQVNGSGEPYIYIAIRRGPMRQPTSGTEVFYPQYSASGLAEGTKITTGFPVDMQIQGWTGAGPGKNFVVDRLRRVQTEATNFNTKWLKTHDTVSEGQGYFTEQWDNTGYGVSQVWAAETGTRFWNFRRAPGFFDMVAYTGGGGSGRTVPHNLGVAPEMMWIKRRNASISWCVYHHGIDFNGDGLPETDVIFLNSNASAQDNDTMWNDTAPTATNFTLGFYTGVNNGSGTYIAYLFATLPGVSKVGSYTGNDSSQTINCGFTGGARFILIKRTDSTGDWYVWDTARGIVAGNDPHLSLNTTAAEVTSDDTIDPASSGFIVNQVAATNVNVSSASYIYLAIA